MTVSYFEALESQMPAVEGERMQNAALAALYPHVTKDGARKMWGGWAEQINRVGREAGVIAGNLFTVDGVSTGVSGLRRWFRKTVGRGAEVA